MHMAPAAAGTPEGTGSDEDSSRGGIPRKTDPPGPPGGLAVRATVQAILEHVRNRNKEVGYEYARFSEPCTRSQPAARSCRAGKRLLCDTTARCQA